jgi:hypothetical protein
MSRGPVKVWAISPALQGKLTTGNVWAVSATSIMLFPWKPFVDM